MLYIDRLGVQVYGRGWERRESKDIFLCTLFKFVYRMSSNIQFEVSSATR